MTDHASGNGSSIKIMVHIQQVEEDGRTTLVWYYNGVTGNDLAVMANIYTSEIHFELDDFTKGRFKFENVTVERGFSTYGLEYKDLSKKSVDKDCVVISDDQINHQVKVGGLTFSVSPLKAAAYGTGYDESTFESPDPEVINTGENGSPPPSKEA